MIQNKFGMSQRIMEMLMSNYKKIELFEFIMDNCLSPALESFNLQKTFSTNTIFMAEIIL